jgi:hypothetical protein
MHVIEGSRHPEDDALEVKIPISDTKTHEDFVGKSKFQVAIHMEHLGIHPCGQP